CTTFNAKYVAFDLNAKALLKGQFALSIIDRLITGVADPVLVESIKLAELSELRSRRAEIVGFVLPVAVTDRHATEQHLIRRQPQETTNSVVKAGPGLLRAGIEAVAARQERQCMDIATEVGPLTGTEPAVDGDEKRHWRTEKLEVLLVLREASGGIVAINAERTIEL